MSCRCCDRFLKSSSLTVTGGNVLITVESPFPSLVNLRRYCLLIAQNLPAGSGTLPVQISINGTVYPVYIRSGNLLRADQIRCRRLYPIIYGNDPVHFSLLNCVINTVFSQPETSVVESTNA